MSDFPYTENVNEICSLFVCCDINGLMQSLNLEHDPTEWRLFIDSSKQFLRITAGLNVDAPDVTYTGQANNDLTRLVVILRKFNHLLCFFNN